MTRASASQRRAQTMRADEIRERVEEWEAAEADVRDSPTAAWRARGFTQAREDVVWLLAEVARLRAALSGLIEVGVVSAAEPSAWIATTTVALDLARAALAADSPETGEHE